MSAPSRPGVILGPGHRLLEELEARGWTQKDLAEILGRPVQAINEIVKGAKQITPETAIQLADAFGTSAKFWLDLETSHRLRLAMGRHTSDEIARRRRLFELVPVPELLRRNWIPETSSFDELERAVLRFLRIEHADEEPKTPIANLRNTPSRTPQARAQLAWTMRAVWLAEATEVRQPYARERLTGSLDELFSFARDPELVDQVPGFLSDLGLRVVFVPHLPQTYLDGAAFWLAEAPVIVLTLRFDRLDYFWFTLAHELAHVLDDGRSGVVDDEGPSALRPAGEQRADQRAQNWLIPPASYRAFVRRHGGHPARTDVVDFAAEVGRHPSILLGRLQHDRVLTWAQLRDLHVGVRDALGHVFDRPSIAGSN